MRGDIAGVREVRKDISMCGCVVNTFDIRLDSVVKITKTYRA